MFRVRRRTVLVVALAGTLALATFAFTASNTVPGSKAGKGEGVISGYAVSSVAYTLSSTNPANIDSVAFTFDAAAATVKAKLVASSSAYRREKRFMFVRWIVSRDLRQPPHRMLPDASLRRDRFRRRRILFQKPTPAIHAPAASARAPRRNRG